MSHRIEERRGIGSEFDLDPHLIFGFSPKVDIPLRIGVTKWVNSGRSSIALALSCLRKTTPHASTCLLPAYLCPSVLQPFREAGVSVKFYKVNDRLQIDLDDLRSCLNSQVLAVVVIHYFGFPQPDVVFDSIGSEINTIEDVTHGWLSTSEKGVFLGNRGTISVYSPRKFFPVPDIGIVVGDKLLENGAEVYATDWIYATNRVLGLFFRWLYRRTDIKKIDRLAFDLLHKAERSLNTSVRITKASWISQRILANLDIEHTVRQRRQNYQALLDAVAQHDLPLKPLFFDLPNGVTPLGFPVICDQRDELKQFLIQRRIFPPIHWQLPSEVNITRFRHLVWLSEHILTIPIDQRYDLHDMEYVIECLLDWKRQCRFTAMPQ